MTFPPGVPAERMDPRLERFRHRADVEYTEDEYALPRGKFGAARESATGDGFGVGVLAHRDGWVALVRNAWSDGWVYPGGSVEPGEDPRIAAEREVEEELGVEVDLGDPLRLSRQTFVRDDQRFENHFLLFEGEAEAGSLADDPGEDGEGIREVTWHESVPERVQHRDLLVGFLE